MATNYPTSLDTDNSLYLVKNQAKTTISGDLGASGGNNNQANSIDVVDGSGFPTTAGFFICGLELISFTSRVTNKFLGIVRAYGGTTALVHRTGSVIKMPVMAEFHNNDKDAIVQLETKLGVAGSENYCKRFSQATDPNLVVANNILAGDIWDDTTSAQVKIFSGGVWKVFAG